jgi:membrane-associated phospholipid phosphatase
MNKSLAKVISILFHPAIYPIIGIFLILRYLPYHYSHQVVVLSMAMVFIGTYLIPVLVSILLFRLHLISSLMMNSAKDRKWPYAFGALSFLFTAHFIYKAELASEAYLFLLGSAVVFLLHLSLLNFLKPSAHMAGIGGFLALLMAVSAKFSLNVLPFILLLFFLAGLIGSARLSLDAHTPRELWIGFSTGLVIVFSTIYFF